MNDNIIKVLQEECIEEISFFSEVYLFGSSLCRTNPNDIDLLIIYEEGADSHIEKKKGNIFDLLMSAMGIECHFVTLSRNEIDQTKFLNHVVHKKLK